jgi:16S rRNA (guanine527-N7)-methyltransferase
MEVVLKYFDDFTKAQLAQFNALHQLYMHWNNQINVISRKDIDSLYEKHVLHSLSIAAIFNFEPGTRIIDIGCGGGFPGIPLALFYPEVQFVLCDSIGKKLKVAEAIIKELNIKNATTQWCRAEDIKEKLSFDYAVSRAVAPLKDVWAWSTPLVKKTGINEQPNGLICLKGGDLNDEISQSNTRPMVWPISDIFEEPFFETKSVVYVKRS